MLLAAVARRLHIGGIAGGARWNSWRRSPFGNEAQPIEVHVGARGNRNERLVAQVGAGTVGFHSGDSEGAWQEGKRGVG